MTLSSNLKTVFDLDIRYVKYEFLIFVVILRNDSYVRKATVNTVD